MNAFRRILFAPISQGGDLTETSFTRREVAEKLGTTNLDEINKLIDRGALLTEGGKDDKITKKSVRKFMRETKAYIKAAQVGKPKSKKEPQHSEP